MDAVDELARKLISAFEPFSEEVALEQLAIPEDLADPESSVDLWVASAGADHDEEDRFAVRAQVSVLTAVVLKREVGELSRLFREELLRSQEFRRAYTMAGVASHPWTGMICPL